MTKEQIYARNPPYKFATLQILYFPLRNKGIRMIRLVVISDSPPTITPYFDKPKVTIGSSSSPFADLMLFEETLHDKHLEIIQEHQFFYAINVANDPFATVNGKPFRKKKLGHNDIIQIGNAIIRIEWINDLPISSAHMLPLSKASIPEDNEETPFHLVDTKELLPIILENKFSRQAEELEMETPPFAFNITAEEEQQLLELQNNNIPYEDFEKYEDFCSTYSDASQDNPIPEYSALARIDQLPSIETEHTLSQQTTHPLAESLAIHAQDSAKDRSTVQPPSLLPESLPIIPKVSLKDYYLSEYDDISDLHSPIADRQSSSIPKILFSIQNWIIYLKIIAVAVVLILIGLGLFYLWMTDQSDKDEIYASKGVADVAMALTYAQIKNIHPQNQNWSDPEFIKNNLMAVLPSKYFSHVDFDAHGNFTNCPYFLRIYTSGDLSQFLVLAQPAPSLLQWLIPKSTVIIDSHSMEMRKTEDLKSLNRLLVNASTLDGTNAIEIFNLVQQGTLIPLANLVNKGDNIGFSPPKALALMRPGAENLVYNAPRYFPLTEELMKKSLDLIEKPASNYEVLRLQLELNALRKLPDIVLYVSGSIQNAIHVQKALATFSPKEKFLIAYLQTNSKGQISNSHLLIDDSIQEGTIAENLKPGLMQDVIALEENLKEPQPSDVRKAISQEHNIDPVQKMEIDEDNPLFLQFSALSVFRQQALRPLNEEIIATLNQETQAPQGNFESKIKQLLSKYIEVDNEQQVKLQRKIDGIYRENTHVSASHFFHLAKIAGIKQPLMDYLGNLKRMLHTPEFTQEKLDKYLQKIEKASNWQEFEQEVAELIEILNLERIPDEETIIAFQNSTRSRIIQKLNQFILSPEHPQILQAFDPEYRYTLIHILKMGWITDPDTYEFYLNEFDLRANPRGSAARSEEDEEEE